jgi:hypothetical protein
LKRHWRLACPGAKEIVESLAAMRAVLEVALRSLTTVEFVRQQRILRPVESIMPVENYLSVLSKNAKRFKGAVLSRDR